LVDAPHTEMDGRAYDILRPSAEALADGAPRAATLLYRSLVIAVLNRALSKYYPYAARDFAAAAALSDRTANDPTLPGHREWVEELHRTHGRKAGFWSLVPNR